ncbi:MAG: hypothetical protein AAF304_02485, partial [Pseudomonadota bacterium]
MGTDRDCVKNKYENSRPIDFNWDSEHPNVKNLVLALQEELFDSGMYERMPNSKVLQRIRNHIKYLILDLFLAYCADEEMYLGYSRTRDRYNQDERYNYQCISYSIFVRRIVDGLLELNYLDGALGFRNVDNSNGFQSRMRPTKRLIN